MTTFTLTGDPIRPASLAEKAAGLQDDRLVQMTDADPPVEMVLPGVKTPDGGLWLYAIYRRPNRDYRIVCCTAGGGVVGQWMVSRPKQAEQVGALAERLTREQSRRMGEQAR